MIMSRRASLALAFAIGLAPALARGQSPDGAEVDRILAVGKAESRVMEHLDVLSNRIGPRLTSSDALQNACEWAVDRFKELGVEEARLEQWGEFPVGFNRGPWSGRIVEPSDKAKALEFGTNSWTAGTKGVVRGHALLAPTDDDQLDAIKDKLKGAWVLSEAQARGGRAGGEEAASFRRKLEAAYEEAGIAGLVRGTRNELIVTSGNYRITWDDLPTTPVIDLVRAQYDELKGLLDEGQAVTLEFDVRNYFKKGPIPQYNVIADIPGTEKPDEYVIIGGHLDTWDGATGTTDNGTGCATTLEAARILVEAGIKPKRTIRFMLWGGEEQGLLGSRAYVQAHPELMPKISAVLVHDGGTNYLSGIGYTKAMEADMTQVFALVIGLNEDLPFAMREVPGLTGGGSDHASFLSAGVPGFFWRQAGRARYQHTHHTQFDTYDAAIPEYQEHSALVVALAAYGLANLDHLLPREGLTSRGGAIAGRPGGGGNRRLLGVQLEEDLAIGEVIPGSVAEKAGLKAGDKLIKVEGKAVGDREALVEAVAEGPAKKSLTFVRDGEEKSAVVEWPAPGNAPDGDE